MPRMTPYRYSINITILLYRVSFTWVDIWNWTFFQELLLDPVHNLVHSAMSLRKYREVTWLTQTKASSDPLFRFLNFFSRYLHTERTKSLYYAKNEMEGRTTICVGTVQCTYYSVCIFLTSFLIAINKKHFAQIHDKLLSEMTDHFESTRAVKADAPLLFLYVSQFCLLLS